MNINDWTTTTAHNSAGYSLDVRFINDVDEAAEQLVSATPNHFNSHYSRVLARLGKEQAAAYLQAKLPTTKNIRSGDLGEIIASEYIEAETNFEIPVKRLRHKDHRNMSMRGDDAIGVYFPQDDTEKIAFLKMEAKSRQALSTNVVSTAREALDDNDGRPSPHSLGFIADRLFDQNEDDKACAILKFNTASDVDDNQIEHMLFTYSRNDPTAFHQADQRSYSGNFFQNTVGIYSPSHTDIIQNVFETIEEEL
tara:strand:+ start:2667 stop:3422 length:756 start_codon:yes stop_codon:yes gene_type:complete